jgi:hypothetical protein
MSRDFFNKAAENTVELEKQIMPEPYKYYKFIRTPKEMGMSTKGGMKELQDNVASLVSYGELLISGKGPAGTAAPLGNKYFLKTGGQCNASDDKEKPQIVDRYVYVDNVPRGNIPMSDNSFIKFQEFKGLIPGMLQDIEDINTATLFRGFMEEEHPRCREYKLPVRGNDNKEEDDRQFIADSDVREMNACSFPDRKNPITGIGCKVDPPKPTLREQKIETTDAKLKTLEKSEYGGHIPGKSAVNDAMKGHDHAEHHPQGIDEKSGAGAPKKTPAELAAEGVGNVAGMAAGKNPGGLAGLLGNKGGDLLSKGMSFLGGGKGGDLMKKGMSFLGGNKGGGGGDLMKLLGGNKGGGDLMKKGMSFLGGNKGGGGGDLMKQGLSFLGGNKGGGGGDLMKQGLSFLGGFQNKYDNKTLCSNLEKDPFARFYIIAFIFLLGFLIYKAFLKKNRIKDDPSMIFIVSVIVVFGYLIYKNDHQIINLYKYGKHNAYLQMR